jgi:hypothetical protein
VDGFGATLHLGVSTGREDEQVEHEAEFVSRCVEELESAGEADESLAHFAVVTICYGRFVRGGTGFGVVHGNFLEEKVCSEGESENVATGAAVPQRRWNQARAPVGARKLRKI